MALACPSTTSKSMNQFDQARKKLLRGNGELRTLRRKMKSEGKWGDYHEKIYLKLLMQSRQICHYIQNLTEDTALFIEVAMDAFQYGAPGYTPEEHP